MILPQAQQPKRHVPAGHRKVPVGDRPAGLLCCGNETVSARRKVSTAYEET
jgi:hypothetical protein